MEASDADLAKQRVEQEAREQQQRQQQPPPVPQEPVQSEVAQPQHRIVAVVCGNCKANFEFPVEARTLSFGFDCTNCGAHNEVDLQQAPQ